MFSCKTAERVQQLLKEGAKVNDKRGDGSTPLIAHAESGNLSVVKELISVGANVDEKDQVMEPCSVALTSYSGLYHPDFILLQYIVWVGGLGKFKCIFLFFHV